MSVGEVTDLTKGIVGDSDWIRRWQVGSTGWHRDTADPFLLKNEGSLFRDRTERIFLPLCGKSHDLLWLYEKGHTVVGVELAEQAVKELFEDNKFEYSVEEAEVGKVYSNNDRRLVIFVANIFNVPVEKLGKFDTIWDKQSFTAINLDDHIRYRDLLYGIMKPEAVCYLKTLEYDETVWPGPPHSISKDVVEDTFGDALKIEILEETETKPNQTEPTVKSKESSEGTETVQNSDVKVSEQQVVIHDEKKILAGAPAALKTSSFRYDRWYKMVFK